MIKDTWYEKKEGKTQIWLMNKKSFCYHKTRLSVKNSLRTGRNDYDTCGVFFFQEEFFKEEMPSKSHALWGSELGPTGDDTEQNCPEGLSSEQSRNCILQCGYRTAGTPRRERENGQRGTLGPQPSHHPCPQTQPRPGDDGAPSHTDVLLACHLLENH